MNSTASVDRPPRFGDPNFKVLDFSNGRIQRCIHPALHLGNDFLLAPCFAIGSAAGDTISGVVGCCLTLAAFLFAKDKLLLEHTVRVEHGVVPGCWGGDGDPPYRRDRYALLHDPGGTLLIAIAAHWRIRRLIRKADLAI